MIELTPKQKDFIEQFGVVQEQYGLAPVPARVNALLTVADKKDLSFDEIRDALHLSKSSASNAVNTLLSLKRIGYRTKLGDRKRYFFSRLDHWQETFKNDVLRLRDYKDIIDKIVKNRTEDTPDYNSHIKQHVDFLEYFTDESLKIIDRWEKMNGN